MRGGLWVSLADLEAAEADDVLLWEVSNRHLRDRSVPVDVAILTNITRNHIEDHGSWEAYVQAKLRLPLAALSSGGHAIVCGLDPVTARHLPELRSSGGTLWVVGADAGAATEGSAWIGPGGELLVRPPGADEPVQLGHVDDLPLPGSHNHANLLAALCAGLAVGASPDALRGTVADFPPLAGRLEEIAKQDDVRWIYDIQATTAPAAEAGIRAVGPGCNGLVLMVGGEDKGMDYSGMANAAAEFGARVMALPGSGTDAFLTALDGRCTVTHLPSLDEAIAASSAVATRGDAILLSPGCAFFHRDYIEPGGTFTQRVHRFLTGTTA